MIVAGARKYAEAAGQVPGGEKLAELVTNLTEEVEWHARDLHLALAVVNAGLRTRRTMLKMRTMADVDGEEADLAAQEAEQAYAEWMAALVEFESAP
jgi:hypothetical protein